MACRTRIGGWSLLVAALAVTVASLGGSAAASSPATSIARRGGETSGAGRDGMPSLSLRAALPWVTVKRFADSPALLDIGVYLAAQDAPLDLRAGRPDYASPVTLEQVLHTASGPRTRTLPTSFLDGFAGLARFAHATVTDQAGKVVLDRNLTFCPDPPIRQRIDDTGPIQPTFPVTCGPNQYLVAGNPFLLREVWGIDRGWSAPLYDGDTQYCPCLDVPDGHYLARISINVPYREAFGIPDRVASVAVGVNVKTHEGPPCCAAGAGPSSSQASPSRVPVVRDPDPSTLPDLVPLPSWGIVASNDGERDLLQFDSNVWVAGNAPLVVEGFRRPPGGPDVMDAYQYFYRDGEPVGRARVGTIEFDMRSGHKHWHFEQLVRYTLLDASKTQVVASHKQSFCLAPTDAIDLGLPAAEWTPLTFDPNFDFSCSDPKALWIRESLPVGWGDSYSQGVAGQAFDITDVPNGTYYIQITANPLGRLFETNRANDASLRKVILGGEPGNRTVEVPPWHGIDGPA